MKIAIQFEPNPLLPERGEDLFLQIREELVESDIPNLRIEKPTGSAPLGTKGGDVFNTLVVILSSGSVLTAVVKALQAILDRHRHNSITLQVDGDKLSMTGLGSSQQDQLIRAWVARHSGGEVGAKTPSTHHRK